MQIALNPFGVGIHIGGIHGGKLYCCCCSGVTSLGSVTGGVNGVPVDILGGVSGSIWDCDILGGCAGTGTLGNIVGNIGGP
eukprot:2640219-Ditylum_brightwellii.AAC.1